MEESGVMEEIQKPTKICLRCRIPKDINCYSPGEWRRKHGGKCIGCVRKNTLERRGTTERTPEQKNWCRGNFVVSENSLYVKGEQQ
jgi:hypothetical protein